MTRLFDIFPGWVWALMLAGVIAACAVTGDQLRTERTAHLKTQFEHQTWVAAAERERADEESKRRKTERGLNDAFEIQAQEVVILRQRAEASRAAADAAAGRLRIATQATAQRARAQCADTGASELRAPADDPIGLLADVLGRADERAGELARVADDRGLAGRACERAYDEARSKLMGN